MKSVFFPGVATALVSITPFLLSFEKGQDIVRGLFDFSIFALLLVLVFVKNNCKVCKPLVLVFVIVLLFVVAFIDLGNLLAYKGGVKIGYVFVPVITCSLAMAMVWRVKSVSINDIGVILFFSLVLHMGLFYLFPNQPLLEFPLIKAFPRFVQLPPSREVLPLSYKSRFILSDSVSVTKYYVDTSRNNVVVLVESWGVPLDSEMFEKELDVFEDSPSEEGIHFRRYSRTRTAEREDLLDSAWRNKDGSRDSLFMPNRFKSLGFQTVFVFGGDSTIHWRYQYIRNIGFENVFFADSIIDDKSMSYMIDSLLNVQDSTKRFIAWTTRDTRFPIDGDSPKIEKLYYQRLFGTLQSVADLARKHPETRFIVQGDHEPILSPQEFQCVFFRRWVPYIILN